jgi:outer membrane protein OmpA-like peptidoglycan-associated protein
MKKIASVIMGIALLWSLGCASTQEAMDTKTGKGAAIGAAVGAVAGAVIGHQSGSRTKGAVIGGVTGAVIGGAIGHYLDKQEKEISEIPNTRVVRHDDRLVVDLSDAVFFRENSATLDAQAKETLSRLADVMIRYPKSDIFVNGHTDGLESRGYDQYLSERRAKAVKNHLVFDGVAAERIMARGFGARKAVAPDDTPEGRQENRRVEIEIRPRGEG